MAIAGGNRYAFVSGNPSSTLAGLAGGPVGEGLCNLALDPEAAGAGVGAWTVDCTERRLVLTRALPRRRRASAASRACSPRAWPTASAACCPRRCRGRPPERSRELPPGEPTATASPAPSPPTVRGAVWQPPRRWAPDSTSAPLSGRSATKVGAEGADACSFAASTPVATPAARARSASWRSATWCWPTTQRPARPTRNPSSTSGLTTTMIWWMSAWWVR